MKNNKVFLLALFSVILSLSGCQSQGPVATIPTNTTTKTEIPITPDTQISLDIPFTLEPGQTATFAPNSSSVTFISVESDSRCPSDVQCVWAGEATVNLKIDGFKPTNDNIQAYSITTMDNKLNLGIGEGTSYILELSDLAPYPGSKTSIASADYQATFKLSKAI